MCFLHAFSHANPQAKQIRLGDCNRCPVVSLKKAGRPCWRGLKKAERTPPRALPFSKADRGPVVDVWGFVLSEVHSQITTAATFRHKATCCACLCVMSAGVADSFGTVHDLGPRKGLGPIARKDLPQASVVIVFHNEASALWSRLAAF